MLGLENQIWRLYYRDPRPEMVKADSSRMAYAGTKSCTTQAFVKLLRKNILKKFFGHATRRDFPFRFDKIHPKVVFFVRNSKNIVFQSSSETISQISSKVEPPSVGSVADEYNRNGVSGPKISVGLRLVSANGETDFELITEMLKQSVEIKLEFQDTGVEYNPRTGRAMKRGEL